MPWLHQGPKPANDSCRGQHVPAWAIKEEREHEASNPGPRRTREDSLEKDAGRHQDKRRKQEARISGEQCALHENEKPGEKSKLSEAREQGAATKSQRLSRRRITGKSKNEGCEDEADHRDNREETKRRRVTGKTKEQEDELEEVVTSTEQAWHFCPGDNSDEELVPALAVSSSEEEEDSCDESEEESDEDSVMPKLWAKRARTRIANETIRRHEDNHEPYGTNGGAPEQCKDGGTNVKVEEQTTTRRALPARSEPTQEEAKVDNKQPKEEGKQGCRAEEEDAPGKMAPATSMIQKALSKGRGNEEQEDNSSRKKPRTEDTGPQKATPKACDQKCTNSVLITRPSVSGGARPGAHFRDDLRDTSKTRVLGPVQEEDKADKRHQKEEAKPGRIRLETINVTSANVNKTTILHRKAHLQFVQEICLTDGQIITMKGDAAKVGKTFDAGPRDPEQTRVSAGVAALGTKDLNVYHITNPFDDYLDAVATGRCRITCCDINGCTLVVANIYGWTGGSVGQWKRKGRTTLLPYAGSNSA